MQSDHEVAEVRGTQQHHDDADGMYVCNCAQVMQLEEEIAESKREVLQLK